MREDNVVAPYKKTEREINELILRQYENLVKLLDPNPAQNPQIKTKAKPLQIFHLPVGELGATYSKILFCNITIWRTEGFITWS